MADNKDERFNDNKEHIPRGNGQPIKNNNNNKPSSPTVNETFLKESHNKETNKEDKYKTMGTSYNKKRRRR